MPAPGTPGGALNLDGHFGLSPHLEEMHKLFAAGELTVLHAVASPYRERSHFDAQNLLENGTIRPFGRETGWLNVALGTADRAGGTTQPGTLGFALGPNVPLVLRGPAQIGSWSPSRLPAPDADLLDRLAALYRDDALLGRSFAVAREAQAMMEGHDPGRHGQSDAARRGACPGGRGDPRQAGWPAGGDHRFRRLGHAHQPAGRVQPADAQPAPARPLGRRAQDSARPGVAAHRGADRHGVRSRGGAERLGRNGPRHRRSGLRRRRRGAGRARDLRIGRASASARCTRSATCGRRSTCAPSSRRRSPPSSGSARRRSRRRCFLIAAP